VVRRNGVIEAGNGLYRAAVALGWKEIAAVYVNDDDDYAKGYAVMDNQSATLSEWDLPSLRDILESLDTGAFDMDATGFDEHELEQMMTAEHQGGLTDDDSVPDEAPPVCQPGELWLLGEHRVMCGDSTKAEDVARLMGGQKAEFGFTSPPYNLGKNVALRNGARKGAHTAYNHSTDDFGWLALLDGFIGIALGVTVVLCVNLQLLADNKVGLLSLLGKYNHKTIDVAVWVKSNPQPAMADHVMTSAFELLWFLSSNDNPSRAISTASFQRGGFSNVFESGVAAGHDAAVHGAVFPVALAEHFVGACTQYGHSILDSFLGSGTTLIACEKLGRKCYGMEIDPHYCDVIIKRWEEYTGKKATLNERS
jgi:DNA modification methylase